ncbi:pyruvate, water dikinase regulatory protein [uncultured Trichococcus sp.]|uniref:pyruvate, water dikinase regulatory protein n=1 Tax=uncultured Trichococcus sp. TaxID=189665 RepID=UPI0029C707C8|nr:pyruvate, water dikinase regulatory protein [uncultured Trichococcus sp.]
MEQQEQQDLHFVIISDSVGDTARKVLQAVLAQFPSITVHMYHYPFIRKMKDLEPVLEEAKELKAFVIHTLVVENLSEFTDDFCAAENLPCYNILKDLVRDISETTGQQPLKRAGALHRLDDEYFNRISAIEFAVKYDDGKDPKGFLDADLVLLGVSRTSKTPLSMFLANKNIKVANLPIMPEASVPDEIWQVDPKKIVGLTNDAEVLNNFRKERMIAYGLSPETIYSDMERIRAELEYAYELYNKLGCIVINVSKRSIEETAAIIMTSLEISDTTIIP